jgi:hypothetical protein
VLVELRAAEIVALPPKRVEIAMPLAPPASKFDAQLERAFGRLQKRCLVQPDHLIERLDRRNGRSPTPIVPIVPDLTSVIRQRCGAIVREGQRPPSSRRCRPGNDDRADVGRGHRDFGHENDPFGQAAARQ